MDMEMSGNDCIWGGALTIRNSTVHATGSTASPFRCSGGITLDNCHVTLPEDGYVNGAQIVDSEGNAVREVLIEPGEDENPVVVYDLLICGKRVTNRSASDVLGDGAFCYNAEHKVLTVSGDASTNSPYVVYNQSIDGLTVDITKDVKFTAGGTGCIAFDKNTTLKGSGKLTIEAQYGYAILAYRSNLNIENMTIEATGRQGIIGYNSNSTLRIVSSDIHVKTTDSYNAAFSSFASITLEGCEIVDPENCYINTGTSLDNEENVVNEVTIWKPAVVYDLFICGKQVTNRNACDVLGDGAFSYDADTNTLTISGDCTYGSDDRMIFSSADGLIINVPSDVTLTSEDCAIECYNTTFTGTGKLTINGNSGAINCPNGTITIDGMQMDLSGIWAFCGMRSSSHLVINNSTLHVTATQVAIGYWGSITLEGCEIMQPEGGRVERDVNYNTNIVDSEGNIAKEVIISPPLEKYDLYICGTQVTNWNASDILGDAAFSYDADTQTLTVSGDAWIEGKAIIYNPGIDGLTVDITKDVKFTYYGRTSTSCIEFDKNTTLKGNGKLTIETRTSWAILVNECNLDIEGMTMDALGYQGFVGKNDATLHITSSDIHVKTTDSYNAAFSTFTSITLEGCTIVDPENCSINTGTSLDNEGNVVSEVTIGEVKYDLYVCDTQVTSNNAEDILGIGGFSYDAATKTLTVSRSLTIAFEAPMINNEGIDGLTINVPNDVTLKTDHIYVWPIRINANTTVTGKGKLTVKAKKQAGFIVRNRSTLTFDDVRVETEGEYGGVSGVETEHLVVRNAVLHAISTSTSSPAIRRFVSLTLDGTKITLPEGGQFRATGSVNSQMVVDANGNMAKEVIIEPVPEEGQLMICRKLVTDDNAYDVLEDGVFRFDASTNTLTINGDCTYDGTIIDSRLSDLTIVSEGESSLRSLEAETIKGYNLTFKNSYPTKVVSDNDAAIRLLFKMPTIPVQSMQNDITENLRIDHCEMEIKGKNYGLYSDLSWEMIGDGVLQPHGYYDLYLWTYLTIVDSKLIVRGNEAAIYHFTEMNCYGYPVIKPSAGEYHTGHLDNTIDTTEFYYQDQTDPNNPKPATEVIIGDSTTAIHDIDANVDTNHSNAVRYNLSGQRVGNDYKGIVIEGGKKMLIK